MRRSGLQRHSGGGLDGGLGTQITTAVPSGATTGLISVTTPGGTVASATAFTVLPAVVAPTLSKSFGPNPITSGGTSTLTLVIDNAANATALTDVAVSDSYPTGLTNATPANGATTCADGTLTAADGGPGVALSGATIPASGSCTVTVQVTSATPAAYVNTTDAVTSTEAPASETASDTLTVNAALVAPTLSKSFGPNPITSGGTSTLTLVIDNAANATALTDVAVSDSYPTGLTNATPANGATTCADGTLTAADGGPGVALSGATIPASGSCTVTVQVTSATPAAYVNTTDAVTSTEAPASETASDTLTVNAALVAPTLSKSFGPNPITSGGTSTLTLTIDNNANATALTDVAVSDSYPTGLINALTPNVINSCGGTVTATPGGGSVVLTGGTVEASGSCLVTVDVTSATPDAYLNTTGTVTSAEVPASTTASDTLTVNAAVIADGDVNDDGSVDSADVLLAQRYLLGLSVPSWFDPARGNVAPRGAPDTEFNLGDLLVIQQMALGL